MTSDILSVPSTLSVVSKSSQSLRVGSVWDHVAAPALLRLRLALAAGATASVTSADWVELRAALREASSFCAALPRAQAKSPQVTEACAVVRAVAVAGATEIGVTDDDVAAAREALRQGWTGLLAAMLLVPAWELPEAPRLAGVPDWMWGEYASWLFAAPRGMIAPDLGERIAAQQLPHLEDLGTWVDRNLGSAAVRAAIASYFDALQARPSMDAGGRRMAALRGRILTRFLVKKDEGDVLSEILPRDGRSMRIGYVARDFGPGGDTFASLATFEQLDPAGYEVFLFSLQDSDTAEARYCERRARSHTVLASDTASQIQQLRAAQLDIVVFCGDLATRCNAITRLALHRVAPLQVANHRTGQTTGLPEIDLYVSGAQPATPDAAAVFTERLGLLRGPAHSYAIVRNTDQAAATCTREDLGLPATAMLFASVVLPGGLNFETCRAWANLLDLTPGSRLAVVLLTTEQDEADDPARFCQGLELAFGTLGVDTARIAIFPATADQPEPARNLLRLADLFLHPLHGANPLWVAESLSLGLPALVVAQADADRDAGAGMLRAVALPGLITANESAYVAAAVAYAADSTARAGLRTQLRSVVGAGPSFLDSLAAADAFGALLEAAYDELAALGRPAFRAEREPLRCFSADNFAEGLEAGFAAQAGGDTVTAGFEANLALRAEPANPRGRYLRAQILLGEGKVQRAVDYLLAALPPFAGDKDYWFFLARALQLNQQVPQAIEALESCLRLDSKQVEPLLMLVELAEAAGVPDIAAEARESLREIAPDDFRVIALA